MISKSLTAEEFRCLPQTQRNIKNFRLLIDGDREECFSYLDKKNLEAFKLVRKERRHLVFEYLDEKTLEAFKLVSPENRNEVFKYLDRKDIEAFKLVPQHELVRASLFQYLDPDQRNFEAFKLVSPYFYSRAIAFKFLNPKSIEAFKLIPAAFRWEVFKYLSPEQRNDETFKLVYEGDYDWSGWISSKTFGLLSFFEPTNVIEEDDSLESLYFHGDRYLAFEHLTTKTIQAFKIVPEKDRHKVFKFLDQKNIEAFMLVPKKNRHLVFEFLDDEIRKEAIKFVPSENIGFISKYLPNSIHNK